MRIPKIPKRAGPVRTAHSEGPSTRSAEATTQYIRGGFSKYLTPARRGVTQSPEASIARGISEYRPSSGLARGAEPRRKKKKAPNRTANSNASRRQHGAS